jgi:endonuclease YncB( thermonuclease family)
LLRPCVLVWLAFRPLELRRAPAAIALLALTATGCGAGAGGSEAVPTGARPARVTGVSDGDTISLSGTGKVRLIGVDTPEVYGGPAECYGREASRFTKRVLGLGRRVTFRLGREQRDRYGRALAYVWLADGRFFNALLVERGYAVPLTIPPNDDFARRFVRAARLARRRGIGLWNRATCAGAASPGRQSVVAAGGARRPGAGPRRTRGAGRRHCAAFHTHARAQRWFRRHGGRRGRDVGGLDSDGDGRACESLP